MFLKIYFVHLKWNSFKAQIICFCRLMKSINISKSLDTFAYLKILLKLLLHSEKAAVEHSTNLLFLLSLTKNHSNFRLQFNATDEHIWENKPDYILFLSLSPLMIIAKIVLTFRLLHTATKPILENYPSTYRLSSTCMAPTILMGLPMQELCTLNIRLLVVK